MPAEGWYVDGVPFEEHGTVIEDVSGWFDAPAMRGEDDVLPGQHGERFRPKKFGPGRTPMRVAIHGVNSDWSVPDTGSSQRVLFERNLEDFQRRVLKAHRPLLVERVHAMRNGSTPRRQALCQAINAVTPEMTGYTYGLVDFEWKVPGAFWSDVDATTQRLGYDLAGPAEQTLELFSLAGQTGYCTDSLVKVSGPFTSVSVRDAETGAGWAYEDAVVPLPADQTIEVDSGAFTAGRGVQDILMDLDFAGPNLLEVVPAPSESRGPKLIVEATGTGPGFYVECVTRRKWLVP
jgi:hypothetical protein